MIPPGQGAQALHLEHEPSDEEFGAPSVTGSATALELPKDEFFDKYNDACKEPSSTGPRFPPGLASFINGNFENPIGELKLKEVMSKWLGPEGVDWLQAPEVPNSVWRLLSGDVRGTDIYFQQIQAVVSTAITGLGRSVQLEREEQYGDSMDCNMEVIQVLCHLHKAMISEERCRRLRKVLPLSYKGLVAQKYDPTQSSILGNVADNAKELSETARLSAQITASRWGGHNFSSSRGAGFRSRPYDRRSSTQVRSSDGRSFQNRSSSYKRQ